MSDLGLSPVSEIWKPVASFEGCYSVSDLGRVRSEARTITRGAGIRQPVCERILRQSLSHGYPQVSIKFGGVCKKVRVHRVVLETFIGPCPDGMEGCHGDGNPLNARLSNLRWDSHFSNAMDAISHGVLRRGDKVAGAKLNELCVLAIRADNRSHSAIAADHSITQSHVSRIKSRDVWAHV